MSTREGRREPGLMRCVALIYNPASGQHPEQRAELIAKVLAVLRNAGVEAEAFATESPESAGTAGAGGHSPGVRHDPCLRRRRNRA